VGAGPVSSHAGTGARDISVALVIEDAVLNDWPHAPQIGEETVRQSMAVTRSAAADALGHRQQPALFEHSASKTLRTSSRTSKLPLVKPRVISL
jgi:hypothetical protein